MSDEAMRVLRAAYRGCRVTVGQSCYRRLGPAHRRPAGRSRRRRCRSGAAGTEQQRRPGDVVKPRSVTTTSGRPRV